LRSIVCSLGLVRKLLSFRRSPSAFFGKTALGPDGALIGLLGFHVLTYARGLFVETAAAETALWASRSGLTPAWVRPRPRQQHGARFLYRLGPSPFGDASQFLAKILKVDLALQHQVSHSPGNGFMHGRIPHGVDDICDKFCPVFRWRRLYGLA